MFILNVHNIKVTVRIM